VNSTCHNNVWACCRAPQLSIQKQRQQDPTVDDAGGEVRLLLVDREADSVRQVIVESASGLFSFVCYIVILILFM